jgi:dihydroorotase
MNNKPVSLLIYGGRLIDPSQGIDEMGSLLISNDEISWLGRGETPPPQPGYDTLHAEGLIVCPGFVDLHCHLRQPGFEEKETIASGTKAAARGGFTTVCCMPNTNPPLDNKAVIDYVKSTAANEGMVRVFPIGCISKGRRGEELAELGKLASAGVVAFSDDGEPALSSRLMRQALDHSRDLDLPITDHCEDTSLSKGGVMNEGVTSTKLGLSGIPNAAEDIIVARDLALAELTGGRLHIAHVTTEGSVELIRRAKEKGIRVTAEVTPHHLTLTEEKVSGYDTSAKVNPPLRTRRDVEALVRGLNDKVIDIIATDHAPHTEAEKQCEFALAPFGISGFETALGCLMSLVHNGELTLNSLIARLTCEPSRIIKQEKLGTLAVGASADVTIFDPEREWLVDTRAFASKGKNNPWAGSMLKGRVMATIARGKLVYIDDLIKGEFKRGEAPL